MKKIFLCISFTILCLVNTRKISAQGNINTGSYAWGENLSWINFAPPAGNVKVTDTAITGYAWSQNYGWINMSPTNGGVTNNTSGQLGGNAWSSGLGGWIPFDGVTINSSGKFTGIAGIAGTTIGRINFDCTNCNVVTDWRPAAAGPTSTPGPGPTSVATTLATATPILTTEIRNLISEISSPTATPASLFDIQTTINKIPVNYKFLIWLIPLILLIVLIFIFWKKRKKTVP